MSERDPIKSHAAWLIAQGFADAKSAGADRGGGQERDREGASSSPWTRPIPASTKLRTTSMPEATTAFAN